MTKNSFFNRKHYLDILIKRINGLKDEYRQNIALIGNELVGKTSTILHLLANFYDPKILPIYISVRQETLEYFSKKFIGALLYSFLNNSGITLKEDLDYLIKKSERFIPKTTEKIKSILTILERKKKESIFTELFSLCDSIYQETQKSCVLILDEFHNLETIGTKNLYKELAKIIILQKHTMFLVISSAKFKAKKTLSENLSLLFGNFEIIEMEPFSPKTGEEFLEDKLGRITLDKTLKKFLINLSGGLPFYLEVIAAALCKIKSQDIDDNQITKKELIDALEDLLFEETGVLNQRFYNYLKNLFDWHPNQDCVCLLYGISAGHNRIKDMVQLLRRQKKEIIKNLNHLLELDVIARNGDFFKINDRLFGFWLEFVHQKKIGALNFNAEIQKSAFRDGIEAMYKEFYIESQKPFGERIVELLHLFENEGVYIEKRRLKLISFREIKSLKFNSPNIKEGLIGRSVDTLWIIAIKDDSITEDDIIEFSKECKKYRQRKQRKIFIAPLDVDINVRLKALEEKIWTWNLSNVNLLCDLFSRPAIIV